MPPAGVTKTAAPCRTPLIASNQLLFKYNNICWAYVEPAAPARVLGLWDVSWRERRHQSVRTGSVSPGGGGCPKICRPQMGKELVWKGPGHAHQWTTPNVFCLLLFLAGGAFLAEDWPMGTGKRYWGKREGCGRPHKSRSNFFQWKTAFWSDKAIHVKTETFCGKMAMSRVFYFGKGKPPKAF